MPIGKQRTREALGYPWLKILCPEARDARGRRRVGAGCLVRGPQPRKLGELRTLDGLAGPRPTQSIWKPKSPLPLRGAAAGVACRPQTQF